MLQGTMPLFCDDAWMKLPLPVLHTYASYRPYGGDTLLKEQNDVPLRCLRVTLTRCHMVHIDDMWACSDHAGIKGDKDWVFFGL